MALKIRIDPWAAEYDGAPRLEDDEGMQPTEIDPFVEMAEWQPLAANDAPRPPAIVFVDGVQRTEANVICDGDEGLSYGALASIGVGAAFVENTARMATETPIRTLALTAGEVSDAIEVPCGAAVLRFEPRSRVDSGPLAVTECVNETRREAEMRLGQRLVTEGCPLVVVDGRLSFQPTRRSMVVGLIKTMRQQYLAPPQRAVLASLPPAARTPLFRIARDRPLYSWYVRLAPPRSIDHAWAGLVRLETLDAVGLEAAVRVADITARWLPIFASTPAWDARAPQNLFPISALEQRLHHELGDRAWVRTAIECALAREVGA